MQRRELKGMFTGLTCSIALVLMATTAWAADGVSSFDAAQFFDNEGVSEHAEAQSLRAEYKLELQWTIGIDFPEAEQRDEDIGLSLLKGFLEISAEQDALRLKVSGRFEYAASYSRTDDSKYTMDDFAYIDELYARWRWTSGWDFRAGKSYMVWGDLDLYSAVNALLMPQSFYRGPNMDLRLPYLSQWMLDLRFEHDSMGYELALLPFFEGHQQPLLGSDWSPSLLNIGGGSVGGVMSGGGADDFLRAMSSYGGPDESPKNFSVAFQIDYSASWGDMKLGGAYVFSRTPTISLDWNRLGQALSVSPSGELESGVLLDSLSLTYEREAAVWLQSSLLLDPFIVRSEVLFSPKRSVLGVSESNDARLPPIVSTYRLPALDASLEAELQLVEEHFFVVQVSASMLFDAPAYVSLVHHEDALDLRPEDNRVVVPVVVGGSYTYTSFSSDWSVLAATQYGVTRGDVMATVRLSQNLGGGHEIATGAMVMSGPEDSRLGQFNHNDYFYWEYKYVL